MPVGDALVTTQRRRQGRSEAELAEHGCVTRAQGLDAENVVVRCEIPGKTPFWFLEARRARDLARMGETISFAIGSVRLYA